MSDIVSELQRRKELMLEGNFRRCLVEDHLTALLHGTNSTQILLQYYVFAAQQYLEQQHLSNWSSVEKSKLTKRLIGRSAVYRRSKHTINPLHKTSNLLLGGYGEFLDRVIESAAYALGYLRSLEDAKAIRQSNGNDDGPGPTNGRPNVKRNRVKGRSLPK